MINKNNEGITAVWQNGEKSAKFTFIFRKNFYLYQKICSSEVRHFAKLQNNSGHAAMAKYPCLTVPMGYLDLGEPIGITFIAKPFEEEKLLKMGFAFEKLINGRVGPAKYN